VRRYDEPFLERYRGLLLGAFALAGILLIGYFFVSSASARSYQCDSYLTPPPGSSDTPASASASPSPTAQPSPSPASTRSPAAATASPSASASPSPSPTPGPDQRLGFVTQDLGRSHLVTVTSNKHYAYCPPASGPHYAAPAPGPVKRNFFGPEQELDPGSWIHNLEHGYVVLLYSCGENGSSCPSADELAQLRQWFDRAPKTAGADACKIPNKVLVARFDGMKTRFALVAWDRVLLMDKFDMDKALKFAEQWIDGPSAPEQGAC
jgi:uncharacterized protein DUF3105